MAVRELRPPEDGRLRGGERRGAVAVELLRCRVQGEKMDTCISKSGANRPTCYDTPRSHLGGVQREDVGGLGGGGPDALLLGGKVEVGVAGGELAGGAGAVGAGLRAHGVEGGAADLQREGGRRDAHEELGEEDCVYVRRG